MSNPTRSYDNGEIIVDWCPELCVHCKNCTTGLPEVFDISKRPWVNIKGATSLQIINQVEACPSGALSMRKEK